MNCLIMLEDKTREFLQFVCDHFLVPATEIPELVQLVFGMVLLTIYSMPEAGSEDYIFLGASLRLTQRFGH